ncbi:MAG: RND family efflux transporter MFP subunit, partial [Bacteroidia bacterium]
ANYQQAISARDLAARELEDTRIYSPTPGLVDVQALQAGEPVQAGVSLFTLQADQGLRMHTWVSEADIGYIQAGAAATVSASGLPGRDFEATIEWVGANADPATGNFPVKLILGGATDGLRPGMTAKAALVGVTLRQALLLPEAALVDRNRRRVVFVLEQGTVHQREPLLGAGFNDRLLVVEGLSAGEQVVIRGHSGLLEGTAVSVRVQD